MEQDSLHKDAASSRLTSEVVDKPAPQAAGVQLSGSASYGGTVQARADKPLEPSSDAIKATAAEGLRGPAGSLPYLGTIQRAFGHHDVQHIQAHTAQAATAAMGATAYATGNHVVFAGPTDLHTAAHEAAHVVQQRAGVALAGGVGQTGDPYERHADAVADQVVAGRSAEELLDQNPRTGASAGVQRKPATPGSLAGIGRAFAAETALRTEMAGGRVVQRRRAGGVSVSNMRFTPREIVADGASTAQGTVAYSSNATGAGATLQWSVEGPDYGCNVDATGKVTAGNAVEAGKKNSTTTLKAVEAALGQEYADRLAVMVENSSSLMNGGTALRPHHYVAIWEAFYTLTSTQAAVPNPRFGQADWKFVG